MRFPTHIVATVSDDTAEFEYCLNKRDNAHNDYHYLPFLDHKMKRLHPTPAITDDSLAPGPSNSKNV
ncbi:hypothetical protein RirG_026960 [Rhizophagus irregularis DAOM 197198w]|uniref:Uncharacterized protein n=3 Tax=Rhizophagus irregularis TaxID=588596 RepID=A0A015NCZ8_RHIIW|nr:hypothetical protein RirG_026960 [Rhizophagus irregularis DAOM 197198w]